MTDDEALDYAEHLLDKPDSIGKLRILMDHREADLAKREQSMRSRRWGTVWRGIGIFSIAFLLLDYAGFIKWPE